MSKQVAIDTIDALKRRMTVQVPSDSVESEVSTRLQSLAGTLKVDGFRQGKVPTNVVESKYGARIRNEVAHELVQKSLQEALMEQEVKIAGQPELDIKPYEKNQDIEFSATFEVYPEVTIPAFETIDIERPHAEINDADIDLVIDRMRAQKATWTVVDRAVQEDDQVSIDYEEVEGDKENTGLNSQQTSVVIGSAVFPGDFEQQLIGKKAGDETNITIDFPAEHVDVTLAGKKVTYAVTVVSVSESALPEVDAEFVRAFGVDSGDLTQLRSEVKENMQRELEAKVAALLKGKVFDVVNTTAKIDLPEALIESEMNTLSTQVRERITTMGQRGKNVKMPSDDDLKKQSMQNLTTGLLISEVTKQGHINVSHEKIRQEVEKISELYEDPAQITQWYYADMSRLASIEYKLAEASFVEWVIEQGKVTDKSLSFDELMELSA